MKSNHFESKKHKKQKAVTEILSVTELFMNSHAPSTNLLETLWFDCDGEVSNIIDNNTFRLPKKENLELNWDTLPNSLNPSQGELNEIRAKRKRDQVTYLIQIVEKELKVIIDSNMDNKIITVAEIGAGSGHLTLLLAYRHPTIKFILGERKEYCINMAKKRINECQLENVIIFDNDLLYFERFLLEMKSSNSLSMVLGLHCCGLLTDLCIETSIRHNAAFVIVPCCYGQIAKPPISATKSLDINSAENNNTTSTSSTYTKSIIEGTLHDETEKINDDSVAMNRSSYIFRQNPSYLYHVSSGADFIYPFENKSDSDIQLEKGFITAKRCMNMIDFDRLLRVCEISNNNYICKIESLYPLSSSPKNNIIIGRIKR